MSENVDFNMSSCPAPPQPTEQEENDAMAKIMGASQLNQCSTSNTQVSAKMAVILPMPPLAGGASIDVNNTATVGCEQIIATAKRYKQTVANVACMLDKSMNVTKQNSTGVNTIKFSATDTLNLNCTQLTVDQEIGVTVLGSIKLSENEMTQIGTETKAIVKDMVDLSSATATEAGATPQGQRILTDIQNTVETFDYKAKVKETINEIQQAVVNNNIVEFTAKNINLTGEQCKFSQKILVNLIATNVVDSTVTDVFKTIGSYYNEMDATVKAESTAKGPDMGKSFWKGLTDTAKMAMLIPIVIVVGLVIVAVAFFAIGPKLIRSITGAGSASVPAPVPAPVPSIGPQPVGLPPIGMPIRLPPIGMPIRLPPMGFVKR